MFTKTNGAAVQGIDALMIKIEVSVEQGFGFCIVGLPDTAVKESYQRILSAVKMCGIEFPRRKVVVNMSARAYDRILRVARTIADLEGSDRVLTYHILEAIGYRNLDRGNWAERRMF